MRLAFTLLFGISAAFGGLVAVASRNLWRSGLGLGLMLLSTAFLYLVLGSELLFSIQILVYVGGVLVLLLFLIMLTSQLVGREIKQTSTNIRWGVIVSTSLFLLLAFIIWNERVPGSETIPVELGDVGSLLLKEYLLPFELVSLVLLAAFIGAAVLARRWRDGG